MTAVTNSGYKFVSWSDGLTTATRTDTNVQTDKTVTASFAVVTLASAIGHTYNSSLQFDRPDFLNLSAKPSTICGGRVDLSWRAVSGASTYKLYRSTNNSTDDSFYNGVNFSIILGSSNNTYTDAPGVGTYSYRIVEDGYITTDMGTYSSRTLSFTASAQASSDCSSNPAVSAANQSTANTQTAATTSVSATQATLTPPAPTVSVSTKTVSCKFDYLKYASYYPELKSYADTLIQFQNRPSMGIYVAYQLAQKNLWNDYISTGISQGRTPCGTDMPSCKFDAVTFTNANPDLKALYGTDITKLKSWYGANGKDRNVCQSTIIASVDSSSQTANVYSAFQNILDQIYQRLNLLK